MARVDDIRCVSLWCAGLWDRRIATALPLGAVLLGLATDKLFMGRGEL